MSSSTSPIKLVIFDMAGTIIEDHGEVMSAFAGALRSNDIPFSADQLAEWKGASKRRVIRHFIERTGRPHDGELVERVHQCFRSELEEAYRKKLCPIAGAASTFAWCRERGIQLATTTGFDRDTSNLILDRTGWWHFFAANVSSDDVASGRPAPYMIFRAIEIAGIDDVHEVANVGDTPLDLLAGWNAGVRGVIGVLTGLHTETRLRREPHTHIIPSIAELPALIEGGLSLTGGS